MAERIILRAEDGMVLTNGTDYGKIIYAAEGADPSTYTQITEDEYDLILAQQEAEEAMTPDGEDE